MTFILFSVGILSTLYTEEDILCSRNVPCHILQQAQAELSCVDDGWFRQPHLAGSDWTLSEAAQLLQVKPVVPTHTQGEISFMATWEHRAMYHYLHTLQ